MDCLLRIKQRSLTLLLVPSQEVAEKLAERAGARLHIWDVQQPGDTANDASDLLKTHERVALFMPHGHKKGRADARRTAARRGVAFHVLQSPEVAPPTGDEVLGDIQILPQLGEPTITLEPTDVDKSAVAGPFDIIGDIHGCCDELVDLLINLGHARRTGDGHELQAHPGGRRVVFLGDFTDRGPRNVDALRLAMQLVEQHGALAVLGNHDEKLRRYLSGNPVNIAAGLEATIAEMEQITNAEKLDFRRFLDTLPHHLILDAGRLVAAHAGLSEELHGLETGLARAFALYGLVGEGLDDEGIPLRLDWAETYRGSPIVVHGHEVYETPMIKNRVYAIDTGCVFGGSLTALRYPEMVTQSVPARKSYAEIRRFNPPDSRA